jgi:hypothetical protein
VNAEARDSPRPWWVEAWPDALAFALGLGLAWREGWNTTDLVWSLWLSSLCVGYAIIVVTIFRPVFQIVAASAKVQAADSGVTVAYKGVMRMHFLIFFFAFAHFAHLENFAVYAVVYFAYFFPWRLLRRIKTAAPGAV